MGDQARILLADHHSESRASLSVVLKSAGYFVEEIDSADGFLRATRSQHHDLILLDAFTADYIPEHLMTAEYLAETRALLTEDGVIAANTFGISDLYDHESTTYDQSDFFMLLPSH